MLAMSLLMGQAGAVNCLSLLKGQSHFYTFFVTIINLPYETVFISVLNSIVFLSYS